MWRKWISYTSNLENSWLSSHVDWGWHVANHGALILPRERRRRAIHSSRARVNSPSGDAHELTQSNYTVLGSGWPKFCAPFNSVTPHCDRRNLASCRWNAVFFTQTAGQCCGWLYFCCRDWATGGGAVDTWAVWYKLAKMTRRSLLVSRRGRPHRP